jgi:hypothetical protein
MWFNLAAMEGHREAAERHLEIAAELSTTENAAAQHVALLALLRHSKVADGLPLSVVEERSCTGHHCNNEFAPMLTCLRPASILQRLNRQAAPD